ncbi:DUF1868 domain-containing protein [Epibacterium ulvae]|uniref:DUF1868 domain-containing protein n=1 Tax=Epibacterium ulvae TaxID=1156985 RepID=UPI002491B465|nr:DUF1868 domain-containing protein [Epibacterium ulvae]
MARRIDFERFTESQNNTPPDRLGTRYDTKGFRPEAGNTVLCHLDNSALRHRAILETRARPQELLPDHLIFTPESSLHMTVFEGVVETRRTLDAWPKGLAPDASIPAATQHVMPHLQQFEAPGDFTVCPVGISPRGLYLDGVTSADRDIMRKWRDALTEPFGYRQATHDTYAFHMTFAYMLDWLPDTQLAPLERHAEELLAHLIAQAPHIPLRRPAFCIFKDMTHFEEVLTL